MAILLPVYTIVCDKPSTETDGARNTWMLIGEFVAALFKWWCRQ